MDFESTASAIPPPGPGTATAYPAFRRGNLLRKPLVVLNLKDCLVKSATEAGHGEPIPSSLRVPASSLLDLLSEHDIDAVRVSNRELAEVIGAIRWLLEHLSPPCPDLTIVRVNIANPVEQMDPRSGRTLATFRQVDRDIVPPDD